MAVLITDALDIRRFAQQNDSVALHCYYCNTVYDTAISAEQQHWVKYLLENFSWHLAPMNHIRVHLITGFLFEGFSGIFIGNKILTKYSTYKQTLIYHWYFNTLGRHSMSTLKNKLFIQQWPWPHCPSYYPTCLWYCYYIGLHKEVTQLANNARGFIFFLANYW